MEYDKNVNKSLLPEPNIRITQRSKGNAERNCRVSLELLAYNKGLNENASRLQIILFES